MPPASRIGQHSVEGISESTPMATIDGFDDYDVINDDGRVVVFLLW